MSRIVSIISRSMIYLTFYNHLSLLPAYNTMPPPDSPDEITGQTALPCTYLFAYYPHIQF